MLPSMWKDSGIPADDFYQVRPECTDVPKTKFKIKHGKTLSARRWRAAFSPEGYLEMATVLGRIQRGGVHPSIRGEVWEFLLGCFDPKSTFDEREQLRQKRRVQYLRWKEECKEMDAHVGSGIIVTAPIITEDGHPINDPLVLQQSAQSSLHSGQSGQGSGGEQVVEKPVIDWKLTLHQIGLDVLRTDRTLVFYEKKENLSKLWDILAVYAWIDKDVGYCQGMSDLCSPMIILLEDEADAFWVFERLMRRLRGNFRCTERSVGVENQLQTLASITQVLDPKLHQHLDALGGGDYLFAFRMFMVLFRRELSFGDSLYLWEMMALEYDPDIYFTYEDSSSSSTSTEGSKSTALKKSTRQLGKYERENVKSGGSDAPLPISVDFLMMWALEYDPDIYFTYEDSSSSSTSTEGTKSAARKSTRQLGKYERENVRSGQGSEAPLPISVFLVASVLKDKSAKLMTEARGIDDVVKILNDITGNLDAKKACSGAMKLHKKYLKKAKKP